MGASSDLELLAMAVRNPGRLCLGPTTVTGGFPHGGTSLGVITDAELVWDSAYVEHRDPMGGTLSEVWHDSVTFPRIYVTLQGPQWDEDALLALFAQRTPADSLTYVSPAETRIGGTVVPSQVPFWPPLLFSAADPAQRSVYFRRPCPVLSLRESVRLSQVHKAGLPLVFCPIPDSANATTPFWQSARLENITL